ncbi:hypothetical protein HYV79_03400 [Candidatus Woesearchaeota archaeon]|nr:hypothetical protein [Candidatus Woesearchaeota archaeon]
MTTSPELLVTYGFVKPKSKDKYKGDSPDERKKFIEELKQKKGKAEVEKQLKKDANLDEQELVKDQIVALNYPKPLNKYYTIYESFHQSIEPIYFWNLNTLRDLGIPWIEKLTDIFSASEHSSFYGAAAQRLGLAQDKVQNFIALVGQFIRNDLFQLIRDLRWIDERIKYHEDARKGLEAAEITLKGIWADLVDGKVQGQQATPNIFQLSRELQFTSLAPFFFKVNPKNAEDVDKLINALDVSLALKQVLKRKLHQYVVWKDANYAELRQRKNFELKYLRQHYNILKMYLNWLKPYMKYAERLRADISKVESADLISAFEGSMVDIELLGSMIPESNKEYYACLLITFEYRTRPSMEFSPQTQQRIPIHVGETRITWRSYAWTKDEIMSFINMKERQDIDDLSKIDSSIQATIDAIGEDLWKYLEEAKESISPTEKEIAELASKLRISREKAEQLLAKKSEFVEEKPKQNVFEPFIALIKGIGELGSMIVPKGKPKEKKSEEKKEKEKGKAESLAKKLLWTHYRTFKKKHGMLSF